MPYNELRFIKKVVYIFDTMEGGGATGSIILKDYCPPPPPPLFKKCTKISF